MNYGENAESNRLRPQRFNPVEIEAIPFTGVDHTTRPEAGYFRNEDRALIDTKNGMYAVFDGMGRDKYGDFAAKTAVDSISEITRSERPHCSLEEIEDFLRYSLNSTNSSILRQNPEAGATAVLAKRTQIGNQEFVSIAHLGDSRAHLVRDDHIEMLTLDHSLVRAERYYVKGQERWRYKDELSAIQQQYRLATFERVEDLCSDDFAMWHVSHLIGQQLGRNDEVKADIKHVEDIPGDTIVLTTDGFHDNLTLEEMQACLRAPAELDRSLLLVGAAQRRATESHDRRKPDDMTAVVINI